MNSIFSMIFDNFGTKTVTSTDKKKKAYVLNKTQNSAIESAEIFPMQGVYFDIIILLDDRFKKILASYYMSKRSDVANRQPEPRLGKDIINHWMNVGDSVTIANIRNEIFAFNNKPSLDIDELQNEVIKKASKQNIMYKATALSKLSASIRTERTDYCRNKFVTAAAIIRSENRCEMPSCSRELFIKDDNNPYLEVHHITPLSQGGFDSLDNAIALCPHCHREAHHGINRSYIKTLLQTHIKTL